MVGRQRRQLAHRPFARTIQRTTRPLVATHSQTASERGGDAYTRWLRGSGGGGRTSPPAPLQRGEGVSTLDRSALTPSPRRRGGGGEVRPSPQPAARRHVET